MEKKISGQGNVSPCLHLDSPWVLKENVPRAEKPSPRSGGVAQGGIKGEVEELKVSGTVFCPSIEGRNSLIDMMRIPISFEGESRSTRRQRHFLSNQL
jgi:hypothetical protein